MQVLVPLDQGRASGASGTENEKALANEAPLIAVGNKLREDVNELHRVIADRDEDIAKLKVEASESN